MQILITAFVLEAYLMLKNNKARLYTRFYMIFKRVFDIILSALLLFFLALPMLIIWLVVVSTSSGGGIFRQKRIGRNKREFVCYKFRTMYEHTPVCSAKQMSKMADSEKYVTRFGRFLRRTSLDELPQLWNVIKGDMSLVGPRPLIAEEEEVHSAREKSGVYAVRPGITGLAQVRGRNFIDDKKKAEIDAQYIRSMGIVQDLKILAMTALGVAMQKGIEARGDDSDAS